MKNGFRNGLILAASVVMLVVLYGCSSAGREFDTAKIQDLKRGVTTKSDIIRMFGEPLRKEIAPKGEVWTYTYVNSHTTGAGVVGHVFVGIDQSETSCDTLELIFHGDILSDYDSSLSDHVDTFSSSQ